MNPNRPSLVALVLALSGLFGLPGCMQNESKVTLLADGSGTVKDGTVVDLEKTKGLMEMARMFGGGQGGGGGPGIPENLDVEQMIEASYSKEALTAQLEGVEGVEVKEVKSEAKDGKRLASREFAFSDFHALGAAVFQAMTAELKKNEDGSFTLEMDALGAMRPMLSMGGGEAGGAGGGGFAFDAGAMIGMFSEVIGDFRSQQTFVLPGAVLETNGTKGEDGKSVTWKFSIDDLKKMTSDGKDAPGRMTVRFKGENLTLKPFKYAPDMAAMTRRLSAPPAAKPGAKAPEAPKTPEPVK